jgi:hypothetical protein
VPLAVRAGKKDLLLVSPAQIEGIGIETIAIKHHARAYAGGKALHFPP